MQPTDNESMKEASARCEYTESCPFFKEKLGRMPAMSTLYVNSYCMGNFISCARYRVRTTVGKEHVNPDLFPSQHDKAEQIIEKILKS